MKSILFLLVLFGCQEAGNKTNVEAEYKTNNIIPCTYSKYGGGLIPTSVSCYTVREEAKCVLCFDGRCVTFNPESCYVIKEQ